MNIVRCQSPNCNRGGLRDRCVNLLVVHYTAGGRIDGTLQGMLDPGVKRSAHFLIARTEERGIVQCCDLIDRAWHAGISSWLGRHDCNSFSIGVELCNKGWFDCDDGQGRYYRVEDGRRVYYPDPELRSGAPVFLDGFWWEPFTDYQYEALARLYAEVIVPAHPAITPDRGHIVGHNEVSPGRKVDPGPAFDWDRLIRMMNDER